MLATDVVNIVDTHGISELARMYQLSRRQAESFEIQARRLVNAGSNPVLTPGSDVGTVRPSVRATEPSEEPPGDDQAEELEQAARAHAARIKHESAGVGGASIADLRSKLAVCERNIEKGYPEWKYQARLIRRTLELVEGVTIA